MRHDAVFLRGLFEIGLNLAALGIIGVPFGIGLEAISISVRGHVAGQAGIAVFPPGAAQPAALFIDGEILSGLAQADSAQDAGHSSPDDGEAQTLSAPIDRQVTLLSAVFLPMMMTLRQAKRIIQTD